MIKINEGSNRNLMIIINWFT